MKKKLIKSILVSIAFLVLAASSSTVKLASHKIQQPSSVTIAQKPVLAKNENLVFSVLQSNFTSEATRSNIENFLSNASVKIVDWTNAQKIYQEQLLTGKKSLTEIDYYILVEGDESMFYYKLIDASSFKIMYASKSKVIDYDFIMTPFNGAKTDIDLSFVQYFVTIDNKSYNEILNSNNIQEVINKSNELLLSENENINNAKKSIKEKYFNDKYAVCLNLATSYLLMKEFDKSRETLKKADQLIQQTSSSLIKESYYIDLLNSTSKKWEAAIKDSIMQSNSEVARLKKSLNINNENSFFSKDLRDRNRGERNRETGPLKFAYLNAVLSLFKSSSNNVDIYDRDLVNSILSTNTEVTKRAAGNTSGADYLLTVFVDNWSNPDPTVTSETINQTDLLGRPNGKTEIRTTYTNNINVKITVKLTNNKDATIAGTQQLEYKNNEVTNYSNAKNSNQILDDLFNGEKINNFYKRILK
jgi:hypothetical protein